MPLRCNPLPQLGAVGRHEAVRHVAIAVRHVINFQQLEVRVPPRSYCPHEPGHLQPVDVLCAYIARFVCLPLRCNPRPQLGAVGRRKFGRHGAVAVRRVIGCQQLEVRVPFVSLRVPDERDRLQPLRALRIKLARFVRVPLPVDPAPQHGAVGCGEMVRHGAVAVRRAIGCQQLEVRVPGVSEHLPEKTGRLQPLDALRA
mmetsp:Transcript_24671/g.82966  ORF Transcript_24671/g.82966 Transcript_24671/m.82966 type:complete len:200 (-) Transcript_24671:347-946(-)